MVEQKRMREITEKELLEMLSWPSLIFRYKWLVSSQDDNIEHIIDNINRDPEWSLHENVQLNEEIINLEDLKEDPFIYKDSHFKKVRKFVHRCLKIFYSDTAMLCTGIIKEQTDKIIFKLMQMTLVNYGKLDIKISFCDVLYTDKQRKMMFKLEFVRKNDEHREC